MRRSTEFIPIDKDYQITRQRRMLEMQMQEAFLRFNCSLMKDYANWLKPIRHMPAVGATDATSLFNTDGFVRSRERGAADFLSYVHVDTVLLPVHRGPFVGERSEHVSLVLRRVHVAGEELHITSSSQPGLLKLVYLYPGRSAMRQADRTASTSSHLRKSPHLGGQHDRVHSAA